jgi:hypothetical protein
MIAIIWNTVFNLPQILAATTFPFVDAYILEASTIISRQIIMIGIKTGIDHPFTAKPINTPLINILSAIGSHNFPKSDIQ